MLWCHDQMGPRLWTHIERGLEVRLAPTPPSEALAGIMRAPVPAYHVPEGVHWGTVVSEDVVVEGTMSHTEAVCMHTDLELVLYNQLSEVAEEVFSLQEAIDKAHAQDEAKI